MNRGAWWATWGHKKLDATEQLTLSLSKICQGARCVLSTHGIHMHSMMGMAVTENAPHNMWNVLWRLARGRKMMTEKPKGVALYRWGLNTTVITQRQNTFSLWTYLKFTVDCCYQPGVQHDMDVIFRA